MGFDELFGKKEIVLACVHLAALPGAPRYGGDMGAVYAQAVREARLFECYGVDGLIVENFRDQPFYPERVPAETVAAMAAVTREVCTSVQIPVGVNVLRNDGEAALAVAAAAGARFVRINVHMGAIVSEQGIVQGRSHETLRLRERLRSDVLIFADAGVKHAAPLADRGLAAEAKDLAERGLADALIVSGELTGSPTAPADVEVVGAHTTLPVLVGSGATPENIADMAGKVRGFIVGSYFKEGGRGDHPVAEARLARFMDRFRSQFRR
jgi:membrane complex biogenesis BtpA family protein